MPLKMLYNDDKIKQELPILCRHSRLCSAVLAHLAGRR